jgi:hypothetical protein
MGGVTLPSVGTARCAVIGEGREASCGYPADVSPAGAAELPQTLRGPVSVTSARRSTGTTQLAGPALPLAVGRVDVHRPPRAGSTS